MESAENKKIIEACKKSLSSYTQALTPITESEINEMVLLLEEKLKSEIVNESRFTNVRLGFELALDAIKNRTSKYEDIDFQNIPSIQSRAIVMLAVDFINGDRIALSTYKNLPIFNEDV